MDGDQIRRTFLEFFEGKGHLPMPSSSLVPAGDPTLLFTSAGMVQFKPYFMGETTPPSRRLTTSQKCFRTTDIDEVGDHKHLTFFEMLGNFSIGDYFKREAIAMAWELVTQRFGLSPDRLFATIYLDDEEAFRHWHEDIGIPEERIYRYGGKDNWWGPAGKEGPCGPCSEIHYDSGPEHGCGPLVKPDELTALQLNDANAPLPSCHPNCDCERFVELWNLVFMQFYQDLEGNRTPLPAPSIDTGLGLERLAAVLQEKRSLYETDLFWPIIQKVCQLTGKSYGQDGNTDYALRVVAEHGRAASFLIADGVVPGNEGRGYVLRRILRRAIRYGRRLGLTEPFLTEVCSSAIDRFQEAYPELSTNRDFIMRVVGLEEERFGVSLHNGLEWAEGYLQEIPKIERDLARLPSDPMSYQVVDRVPFILRWYAAIGGSQVVQSEFMTSGALTARELIIDRFTREEENDFPRLDPDTKYHETHRKILASTQKLEDLKKRLPGPVIFQLHATYGFPPELTAEIAREHNMSVDMEGFEREMDQHSQQSQAAHAFHGAMEALPTYENLGLDGVEFVGYQSLQQESRVAALLIESRQVGTVGHATKGQQVEVVLESTPFYAESGGQVGDAGVITGPNGRVRVEDTQSPVASLIVHRGVVEEGDISLGESVTAQVDPSRRQDAARNHSGTHLLHASLRQILGPHVRQAGSLVAPDRLRFDYSHVAPLSRSELLEIQALANRKIQEDLAVTTRETTFNIAVQEGALAFFGDKYGDVVRVVQMGNESPAEEGAAGPFSLEVCGGTHVHATGQVGPLFVLADSSIGGGMRRVEAVTGRAAEQLYVQRSTLLESLARKLETPLGDLETRLDSFIAEADRLRKRLAALERQALRIEAQELASKVVDVNGVKVVAGRTSAGSAEALREMGDYLKAKLSSAVIALGSVVDGQPVLVTMVTDDLVSKGQDAGKIVKEAALVMEGGGGGRPNMAQAGGKRADKLDAALKSVPEIVRRAAS